ncbi:type II toxin-antitoxin system HipA family toxin [Castellaniella caeni]
MAKGKSPRRRDLEVRLGAGGQVVGRLYLGSGKRSAFNYGKRACSTAALSDDF